MLAILGIRWRDSRFVSPEPPNMNEEAFQAAVQAVKDRVRAAANARTRRAAQALPTGITTLTRIGIETYLAHLPKEPREN